MEVTIKHTIKSEEIENLFVSSFEGGSNYWLHDAILKESDYKPHGDVVYYGQQELYDGWFSIDVRYDDPNDDGGEGNGNGRKTITPISVKRGLEKMSLMAPRHFADIMSDNVDAETADVFMQFVILGEIVYG